MLFDAFARNDFEKWFCSWWKKSFLCKLCFLMLNLTGFSRCFPDIRSGKLVTCYKEQTHVEITISSRCRPQHDIRSLQFPLRHSTYHSDCFPSHILSRIIFCKPTSLRQHVKVIWPCYEELKSTKIFMKCWKMFGSGGHVGK